LVWIISQDIHERIGYRFSDRELAGWAAGSLFGSPKLVNLGKIHRVDIAAVGVASRARLHMPATETASTGAGDAARVNMRACPGLARSQLGADLVQGVSHLGSGREAISLDWSARLDQKLREVGREVCADLSWVDHRFIDHGHCIRVGVVAVAEELVENHADREQVGGDFPAGEVGVGGLVRGGA
jgi:hypothetical protein